MIVSPRPFTQSEIKEKRIAVPAGSRPHISRSNFLLPN